MANTIKNESETKLKTEVKKAFESVDEMVESIKNMESCSEMENLASRWLEMVQEIDTNPEKVITFGNKALQILLTHDHNNYPGSTMFASYVLHYLGSASFDLKRYDESLGYFELADTILCKLEHDCSCLSATLLRNQIEIYRVKANMGRNEEAMVHLKTFLTMTENMMEEGCVELGHANRSLCAAYLVAMNMEAALPFCLKALEIYTKHFGDSSVEVAGLRRFLGVIYCDLGEHGKALELNQSLISVLKDVGDTSDMMIQAEIERGHMLIENGKHEEAMKCLKALVSNPETKEVERGRALIYMARASCYMEKFDKAKKYMEIAQEILEKNDIKPLTAAVRFADMSAVYEIMGDFETALSLLRRVPTMPELPQKLLVEYSTRLFSLFTFAGKEKEGIRYLEDLVEKLKHSLGPEHSQVGYCYKHLGMFCYNAGSLFRAKMYLTLAKDILDVSLGTNHLDSLRNSQNLSCLYTLIRRYDEAIAIQEEVVRVSRGLVLSEQAFLNEAIRVLDAIEKKKENSWCSIL